MRKSALLACTMLGLGFTAAPAAAQNAFTSYTRSDAMGRVTGTIAPDPDGAGPLGYAAVRNTYDAAGRLIRVEKGQISPSDTSWMDGRAPSSWSGFTVFQTVDTAYDTSDRKVSETLSAGGAVQTLTQYSYDSVGRLECTAVRMNQAAFRSLPASACSLGTQGSQGPDRIVRSVYDAAGQVLKVQKAYGTSLQQDYATYEYTTNGHQKAVIDANGNRAEMVYDGLDRQVKWVFPSPSGGGVANQADYEAYAYDANGNRTSLRKRDATTLTYTYDALNRVSQKAVPTSASGAAGYTVNYAYDLRGLQLSATFAASGQGLTNAYDSVGRLTSSATNMGGVSRTVSHAYDADGNRTAVTHPDGNYFAYEYDGLDRATTVRENGGAVLATFAYDAQGRRSGQGYAGAATSYGYDAAGRLSSLGNDLQGTSADQVLTFGYNPASQIVTRTASNDALASNTAYNVSRAYSVNGLNQYTAAGPASFAYDANGNLTSDGSNSYVYDGENRLVSRSGGIALAYDPNGRLFQTSGGTPGTTQFLYDGDELIGEYNSAGTMTARYTHGNGEDDPLIWYDNMAGGYRRGLFTDHQGSIIAASDMYGNPVGTNAYDAWGIPNSTSIATVGRFGYTGQAWLPELGMWYYKARIYSPTLGRFLQTDPIGYDGGLNLHAYVGNDPVNSTDPKGTQCAGNACTGDLGPPIDVWGQRGNPNTVCSGWTCSMMPLPAQLGGMTGSFELARINVVPPIRRSGSCPSALPGSHPPAFRLNSRGGISGIDRGVPADATIVTAPDGTDFYAPAYADFRSAYRSASGYLNIFTAKPAIGRAVGSGGTFDFQRANGRFIPAYTNASNYAVGVTMAGAGFTLEETFAIGNMYALTHSSNAGDPNQRAWWQRGWVAGARGECN